MSRVLTITEPRAVRLLTQGRARWVLGAFLNHERSVAAAARELGLDIRLVHRNVGRLLEAGLLRVVREERRAGRPVKVYVAAAPAFFVPFSATEATDLTEVGGQRQGHYDALFDRATRRTFDALHREQGGGREWGVRLYRDPDGQVCADASYEGAELVDAAVRYQGPVGLMLDARAVFDLTEAEARAVQTELVRLLMRLRASSVQREREESGQTFLVRLGLVGVSGEEAGELR